MESDLKASAWKIVHKGYDDLTQTMIEFIFKTETHCSYLINNDRWYVTKYNEGHYIHYRFIYYKEFMQLKFLIRTNAEVPEYIPFMNQ